MQRLATFLAVLAVISYSQAYRIKVVANLLLFRFILRVLLVDCNAHALGNLVSTAQVLSRFTFVI